MNNDTKNIHFQFEGGETLIRWKDFIKPVVQYIEKNTSIFPTYSLFTNGTIYTEELFNFLKTYNIQVVLSIDGNSEIFKMQRNEKWFELVQNNAKQFLTLPNSRVNAVFTPFGIDYLENSYDFFIGLGVKQLSFTPDNNIDTEWSKENLLKIKKIFYNILQKDKQYHIISIQNSLWNSRYSKEQKIQQHNSSLRIFPNKKITFSSDPFLRNELKQENCTLDNFKDSIKFIDDTLYKQCLQLKNSPEVCNNCLSKYLCHPDGIIEETANFINTSSALCAMRVAFLMHEELENHD